MAQTAPMNGGSRPQASRRQRLLRGLGWLSVALLLVSLAVWWAASLARERALADLREIDSESMRLVVSDLRTELERLELIPQVVARDERIERLLLAPEDPRLADLANRYLEGVGRTVGASAAYVMDVTGLTLAASNWASDRPFVGESFGFRPYFQDALEGLSGRYFARGTASHTRGYYFACPILSGGEIIGVAAVKVGMGDIESRWQELAGVILLTDWHGIVFATNQASWRYRSLRRLDPSTFEAVSNSRRYAGVVLDPRPLMEVEPLDGSTSFMTVLSGSAETEAAAGRGRERYLALSDDLPEYGWVVYTMTSLRSIDDSARVGAALGAVSAGLLLLGAFLFLQRRQYRRQRTLFRQREREMLRESQDELERRIAERTADLMRSNEQLQKEIVEHQRAERALRDTQQGLVQSAKLAALGQLAASVTHELNQPLTALRSYSDNARLLIERGRLAEAGENLGRINRLTHRMAGITQHLKVFARKTEPDEQQVLDVAGAVEAALALVGIGSSSGDVALFHEPSSGPLLAVGDPIRLEQVFVNLLKNAREALEDAERRELHIEYRGSEDGIEVEIRDTGPGIPAENLAKVFEPFFTTKAVGKGLGLGLSVSSGILAEMGGSLRARNHSAGGAVFIVELPRAEAQERVRSA